MRKPSIVIALLLGMTAAPIMAMFPGSSDVSYSADFVMETADVAMTGKLNVAPGRERRQDVVPGGETMISIRRDDLGKLWMLMPSERMYIEMDLKGAMDAAENVNSREPSPEEYDVQMTEEGRETINGLETTKSKVIMTDPDGSKMGGFWWMTDDGILVKMDVIALDQGEKTRLKRELTNIVVGPQDDALFEIPAGYRSMMMGMGAGLLGLPGMGGGADDSGTEDDAAAAGEEEPKKKGFGLGTLKGVLDAVR